MKRSTIDYLLLGAGGGLLYFGGPLSLRSPTVLGGVGLLGFTAYRNKSNAILALGIGAAAVVASQLRVGARRSVVGGAAHPGKGPSMTVQEAAWKAQPNAQQMYPWEQIFGPTTPSSQEPPAQVSGQFMDPYGYDEYGMPYFMVGAAPGPDVGAGDGGGYVSYPDAGPSYGASSGGNPTRTSTEVRSPTSTSSEVRSPTSTSTEVRSPTSTSTEVRSPTSTSTEAFTADNFTATVTGGAGAGATTSVNIYFTPPDHMADDKGHTSHVGVVPPHYEDEQQGQGQEAYGVYGWYPPHLLR